jgi:AcrR family transcriptional regulator
MAMSEIESTDQDEPAKRGRGRPKTQSDGERRTDIIDTARKTFVDLGYAGTTTETVAARCKISKQTLYRLFPSKTDLFLAVVAAHRQMMLDLPRPMGEDAPVADVLQKIFMIDIDEETQREREAFIHIVMREGAQIPEIGEILRREGIDKSRQNLADWLDGQARLGKLVIDNPLSGARILMDMLFGAMGMPNPDWKDRADRRAHLQRCIAIFASGTRPDLT